MSPSLYMSIKIFVSHKLYIKTMAIAAKMEASQCSGSYRLQAPRISWSERCIIRGFTSSESSLVLLVTILPIDNALTSTL